MPDCDNADFGEDNRLPTHARVRAFLENFAKRQIPITYQELAKALQILPPHSIHQVTEILEHLMEEDAAADRPFIAALAISKARGGLPAPGFFDCARRLGRFSGPPITTASVDVRGSGYPKFRNDRGVPEICIGVREFKCIGVSPPQDHPHIYIDMAEADTILCPYCGTRFRFDPRLTPLDAEPPDSLFAEPSAT